jgi:hypothetical protein
VSQKIVMRKTAAAANIGRRIQVSRSEEARTHLTKVRCAWGTLPQQGREVLVRLLKCVLVGGIVVSAGQAYAADDATSEIRELKAKLKQL